MRIPGMSLAEPGMPSPALTRCSSSTPRATFSSEMSLRWNVRILGAAAGSAAMHAAAVASTWHTSPNPSSSACAQGIR